MPRRMWNRMSRYCVSAWERWRQLRIGRRQRPGTALAEWPDTTQQHVLELAAHQAMLETENILNIFLLPYVGTVDKLAGLRLLELGVGRDPVVGLLLAGWGATVTVVDPGWEGWNPEIHPDFYRQLADKIATAHPDWPVAALTEPKWGPTGSSLAFQILPVSLIEAELPADHFHLSYSNAILSYLEEPAAALKKLQQVMAPGSYSIHQVDFRDRQSLDRPLDFCALPRTVLLAAATMNESEMLRPEEWWQFFVEAGFQTDFAPYLHADDTYFDEIRRYLAFEYQQMTPELLAVLGGTFTAHRPPLAHEQAQFTPAQVPGRPAPSNHDRPSRADLEKATRYALSITDNILAGFLLPHFNSTDRLAGLHLLEIGPGRDFTPALILAGFGMKVTLADRFLSEWQSWYHPYFYEAVHELIFRERPNWPLWAIERVLANGDHFDNPLTTFPLALEELTSLPTGSFHITLSNAVFEHLYDVPAAMAALYRLTAPGGYGIHQVDFRDHRNFDRPLEYCKVNRDQLDDIQPNFGSFYGNSLRYGEFVQILQQVGFEVTFQPNLWVEESYFAELQPHLAEPYHRFDPDWLRILGGVLRIQRPAQSRILDKSA